MQWTDSLTSFLLETVPQKSLPIQALQPITFSLSCFWWHPQKLIAIQQLSTIASHTQKTATY